MGDGMSDDRHVHAPFTPDQVANLNEYQRSGTAHPFTCGSGNRLDEAHLVAMRARGDHDAGVLVAAEDGWHCPAVGCGYTQAWAHTGMADGTWVAALRQMRSLCKDQGDVVAMADAMDEAAKNK